MARMAKKVNNAGVMIHPVICSWAHLPSSTTTMLTYAFSTSAKVRVIWSHTFVLHFVPVLSGLACTSQVPISWHSKWIYLKVAAWMILLNILQASSMLPNFFAYMSTKLFPTMTSDLQPLWMICWWTCALQSSSQSGSFPCLLMFFNPGTFHLPTSSNPDQVDQPCSLYIPCMNVTRTERKLHWPSPSAREFSHRAYCTCLHFPSYHYYPTSAKDLTRIPAKV